MGTVQVVSPLSRDGGAAPCAGPSWQRLRARGAHFPGGELAPPAGGSGKFPHGPGRAGRRPRTLRTAGGGQSLGPAAAGQVPRAGQGWAGREGGRERRGAGKGPAQEAAAAALRVGDGGAAAALGAMPVPLDPGREGR